jgi:hypothetical protein
MPKRDPSTEEIDVVVRLLQAAILAEAGQPASAALFREAAETIQALRIELAVRTAGVGEDDD